MSNKYGIFVSGATTDTVEALERSLINLLSIPHTDEKTKQLAIKAFAKGVQPPINSSFHNVNVDQTERWDYVPEEPMEETEEEYPE